MTDNVDRARGKSPAGLRGLFAILGLAAVARLGYVLSLDRHPDLSGGDAPFYLDVATNLATGYGFTAGDDYQAWRAPVTTVGPAYPVFVSFFFGSNPALDGIVKTLSAEANSPDDLRGDLALARKAWWDHVLLQVRIAQALIGAATVGLVYLLGQEAFGDRVGLVAAALLAADPRLVIEAGYIGTETLFIFFLLAALWLYLRAVRTGSLTLYFGAVTGAGLASLTRPVGTVLLVVFLLHQISLAPWRVAARRSAALLAIFTLGAAPLLVRNLLVVGRPLPMLDDALAHFWLGTLGRGEWEGLEAFERERSQLTASGADIDQAYYRAASRAIRADPLGYAWLLVRKVGRAYLQPSSTPGLGDVSIKAQFAGYVRGEVPLSEVVGAPGFLPKLWVWVWHFGGLAAGLAGVALSRRRWRHTLPLTATLVLMTIAYAFLTIIPRYVLPLMPIFLLFAAYSVARLRLAERSWTVWYNRRASPAKTETLGHV